MKNMNAFPSRGLTINVQSWLKFPFASNGTRLFVKFRKLAAIRDCASNYFSSFIHIKHESCPALMPCSKCSCRIFFFSNGHLGSIQGHRCARQAVARHRQGHGHNFRYLPANAVRIAAGGRNAFFILRRIKLGARHNIIAGYLIEVSMSATAGDRTFGHTSIDRHIYCKCSYPFTEFAQREGRIITRVCPSAGIVFGYRRSFASFFGCGRRNTADRGGHDNRRRRRRFFGVCFGHN